MSNPTGLVFLQKGENWRQIYTRRTLCKDEPKMGVMLLYVKECQVTSKSSEARGHTWNRYFFMVLRKNQLAHHLDFILLNFRTVRKKKCHSIYGILLMTALVNSYNQYLSYMLFPK